MARPKSGYHDKDGKPIPGVTTVNGLLAKPALVGWAGKLCTEEAWKIGRELKPMPRWTEILYGTRDAAAEAGTLVHECFETHLRKQPRPELPDNDVGRAALQGFQNAVHWYEGSSLNIEPFEKPLVSETYKFGGTPDALAVHQSHDEWFLADWKTGGLYADHAIQMGAYAQLLREVEGIHVKGCHLVRFHREHGDFAHHFLSEDALIQGWTIFCHLLAIRPDLTALEKRMR